MSSCSWLLSLFILEPGKIVISIVFTLLVIAPVTLFLFGLNEVLRLGIRFALWCKYRGRIQLVSDGKDGVFCDNNRQYCRFLVLYDQPFSTDKLERLINEAVFKDPAYNGYRQKLQQIVTKKYGYYCWRRDLNFALSNQIRRLTNEEHQVSEKQLLPLIENLSNRLGDLQPQWEIAYIPNIDGRKFGVVFNFHRAYGDGMSLAIMLAEKLSPVKPFPYILNPLASHLPLLTRFAFHFKAWLYMGWALARKCYKKPKDHRRRACKEVDDDIPEVCNLARVDLPAPAVKSIRDFAHVPMPAVLLCIYARSVEAVLSKRKSSSLDRRTSNLACGFTIPKFPYAETLANQLVTVETKVALPRGPQPRRRHLIDCLEATSGQLSKSFNDSFSHNDFSLHGRLPASMISWFGRLDQVSTSVALINSNYAFSRKKVAMGSAVPSSICVWPTLLRSDTYNLHISNVSYGDTISSSLVAKSTNWTKEEVAQLVLEIPNQLKYLEELICISDDSNDNDQVFLQIS